MSHKKAISIAKRQEREIIKLFNKLGNTKHPRGWVLTAYRQAHRALRDVIRRNALNEVPEILSILRRDLSIDATRTLVTASAIGERSALDQLLAYGINVGSVKGAIPLGPYRDQWMTAFDIQRARAMGVVVGQDDPIRLVGDETRQGIVRPWPFTLEGILAITTIGAITYKSVVERTAEVERTIFLRQAMAAIDDKTTECCLNVHGQAVKMDKPFVLTGTPRFADELMSPPFHWGPCRTVQVLVRPQDKDDELTEKMLAAVAREEEAREEGKTTDGKTSGV